MIWKDFRKNKDHLKYFNKKRNGTIKHL